MATETDSTPEVIKVSGTRHELTITISPQGEGNILGVKGEVRDDGKTLEWGQRGKRLDWAKIPFWEIDKPKPKPQPTFEERIAKLGPGPGTEGLLMFHAMGMIDCSQCWRLAGMMNKRGAEWCRSSLGMNYCIEDAIDRAVQFWDNATAGEKMRAWMQSTLSIVESAKIAAAIASDKEAGLRMLLERLFTAAIDAAEAKENGNGGS